MVRVQSSEFSERKNVKIPVRDFRDLQVWQLAMNLVESVYAITKNFPSIERYRLTDQLCRAAISVPSNIAEGSSRRSTKEYIRYTSMAYASLAEMQTQLLLAIRLGYITTDKYTPLENTLQELGKMLNGLQQSLKYRLNPTEK